jgi:hypothetical protein
MSLVERDRRDMANAGAGKVDSPRVDRALFGLLVTPMAVGIAALALPHVHLGEEAASAVVFGGSASIAVIALGLVAISRVALSSRIVMAALAAIALGVFAFLGVSSMIAAVVVDAALVALAWAIGATIGRHIEHPGHLLPACVVVACADVASVVSQWGPTHAIAESERALSVMAISFPVPGEASVAPALGVGDLVFVAIVLGAAAVHRLSLMRTAFLCWMGALIAGAASAVFETAVPALVPIGAAVLLGLPAARRVRPYERRVAALAMIMAIAVAGAAIASQLLHPAAEDAAKSTPPNR